MRDSDACVMSGFQSPLEKDVLRFLLRGKVPIILALAILAILNGEVPC